MPQTILLVAAALALIGVLVAVVFTLRTVDWVPPPPSWPWVK